jgi:TPR repeat protein
MMRYIRCAAVALILIPIAGTAQDHDTGVAAYNAGDYSSALREWRPLAEQGSRSAQANLGFMYDEGLGVPQNYDEAARWYRLASEQGLARAQRQLGWLWVRNLPFSETETQTFITAHMWLNIATANGDEQARKYLETIEFYLPPSSILEAQRRAQVCMASDYQDCD